jgi:predicted TIM-barrel fold metal-dependent hydrolase
MFIDESEANAACHPISWCPYLEQYPDLKIVFCHGGGDSDFLRHGQDIENNWTDACIDVIDLYPNRVWIDTAYHQSVCSSPAVYKQALQQFCRAHSDNIVFGSDWPLILFDVPSYGAYINAFREAAGEYWHQMANSNPRRVLGME